MTETLQGKAGFAPFLRISDSDLSQISMIGIPSRILLRISFRTSAAIFPARLCFWRVSSESAIFLHTISFNGKEVKKGLEQPLITRLGAHRYIPVVKSQNNSCGYQLPFHLTCLRSLRQKIYVIELSTIILKEKDNVSYSTSCGVWKDTFIQLQV